MTTVRIAELPDINVPNGREFLAVDMPVVNNPDISSASDWITSRLNLNTLLAFFNCAYAIASLSQRVQVGYTYKCVDTSETILFLPLTASEGQRFKILGEGGKWKLLQSSGQYIKVGDAITTVTSGFLEAPSNSVAEFIAIDGGLGWRCISPDQWSMEVK